MKKFDIVIALRMRSLIVYPQLLFPIYVEQQAETDALACDNVHWGLLVAGVLGAALVVE